MRFEPPCSEFFFGSVTEDAESLRSRLEEMAAELESARDALSTEKGEDAGEKGGEGEEPLGVGGDEEDVAELESEVCHSKVSRISVTRSRARCVRRGVCGIVVRGKGNSGGLCPRASSGRHFRDKVALSMFLPRDDGAQQSYGHRSDACA